MEEIALPVRGVEQRLDISSYLLNLSRWRARGCVCVCVAGFMGNRFRIVGVGEVYISRECQPLEKHIGWVNYRYCMLGGTT